MDARMNLALPESPVKDVGKKKKPVKSTYSVGSQSPKKR